MQNLRFLVCSSMCTVLHSIAVCARIFSGGNLHTVLLYCYYSKRNFRVGTAVRTVRCRKNQIFGKITILDFTAKQLFDTFKFY